MRLGPAALWALAATQPAQSVLGRFGERGVRALCCGGAGRNTAQRTLGGVCGLVGKRRVGRDPDPAAVQLNCLPVALMVDGLICASEFGGNWLIDALVKRSLIAYDHV